MAEITATLVNQLRSRTGQGMMECKRMLTSTAGDIEKAIDEFRKKGIKSSLAERAASEGRVIGAVSADRRNAALVEVNCNTDFTAKSEPVQTLGRNAAEALARNPAAHVAEDPAIKAELTSVAQTTGENVVLSRSAAVHGAAVGLYIYGITGKIGVIFSFSAGAPGDDLIKNLGGHVAFARPIGLTRAEVPPELIAKEKEFAVEQAKATGKPQNIAEKIAEGKMNSFYAERVLLDQEFFNAQVFKGTIANYLKSQGVTLEKYIRLEVGQR